MTQPQPIPQPDAAATEPTAGALGRIPSGLFIVTWREPQQAAEAAPQDRGMLASWVMQAGFEPPMITIAVGLSRDLLAAIDQCTPFVVNVLGESQRSLLARFGRPAAPGEDPFAGLRIDRTATGTAAIADAVAWLECRAVSQTGGGGGLNGDHAVILARVIAAGTGPEQPPLVHLRRNGLRY
jgi:flavin reductase (DIM6/NTAB) family NADH-FMN oxidoreductase RutF